MLALLIAATVAMPTAARRDCSACHIPSQRGCEECHAPAGRSVMKPRPIKVAAADKPKRAPRVPAIQLKTPPPPPPKPKEPVANISAPPSLAVPPRKDADLFKCVSCHSSLTDGRKPHTPLKGGDCSACHVAVAGTVGKCRSPESTAWKLVAQEPALCQKCHDTSGAAPPHPVIKSQGCTACHDPHASSNPTLTKIWPVQALCYKCHAKYDDAEFIHTAVRQGKCLGCHSPHAGEDKPLLADKRAVLCDSCHKKADLEKVHGKHQPFLDGKCLACHDPHRSDNKAQTVEKGRKLCLTCHAGEQVSAAFRLDLTKKTVHKPVKDGDCQTCHGNNAQKPGPDVCFKCHTKFDELYKFQHSAARLGECAVCHEPHSSDNKSLLVAAKINDVCFRCHADDATKRKWVHKPLLEKGCTACHDPHGADVPNALADGEPPALCLKCHAGKGENVKVKHGALQKYACTVCHSPHATDAPKGLVKPVNELCTACHAAQRDGEHIKTFAGKHPVAGPKDPRHPGEPLTCISCHAPHGSDNVKMFYSGATPQDSCRGCH